MVVSPKTLLQLSEQCLRTFNPNVTSEDGHTDTFLKEQELADEAAAMFVRQMFYGCRRYHLLLQDIVNSYLAEYHRMKADEVMFWMIAYLALIRFDDLNPSDFKDLCAAAFQPNVLAEFLGFLFDEDLYQQKSVPLLRKHYGDDFIQGILLEYIIEHAPIISPIISSFEAAANPIMVSTSKNSNPSPASTKLRTTKFSSVPRVALITPRKGLSVPFDEPGMGTCTYERLPPVKDAVTREVQQAIEAFQNGKLESTLSVEKKQENRKQEGTIQFKPPKLHALSRPSNFEAIRQSVQAQALKAMESDLGPIPRPEDVRDFLSRKPDMPVKMTNAAILREDAIYRKWEEEQLKQLNDRERNLHDDTNFQAWQMQMQEQDRREQAALVARRKLEMQLADENAKEVRRKHLQETLEAAQAYKEARDQERQQWLEEEEERAAQLRQVAQQTQAELQEGVKQAKTGLQNQRAVRAAHVKKESQHNEVRLAQLMQLERERKQELITQIRALEAQRPMKLLYKADFDPTTTAGHCLMNEMSIAELRTRLDEVKLEVKREQEQKREEILQKKTEKEEEWAGRVENIERGRQRMKLEKQLKKEEMLAERSRAQKEKAEREEKELLELQAKLAKKRQESLQAEMERRAQEKERRVKAQLLNADKAAMEFKRWQEMEKGAELVAKKEQSLKVEEEAKQQHYAAKLAKQRQKNQTAVLRSRKGVQKDFDLQLEEQRRCMSAQASNEAMTLQTSVMTEKERKQQMIQHKLEMASMTREQSIRLMTHTAGF